MTVVERRRSYDPLGLPPPPGPPWLCPRVQ